ncbi:symmetrical bis(5'-nucleosyl)-tetraphosphatase [Balneatrix alpica]|uniref:symmetrical bis(5'-nucleosyl)-tetraphosphatase n=1 Tax=Balneatrix alpica TaxID=75684 RepID=UPI00273A0A61|nr:symmetrical bis(5'-nucleosyl)-tetraphosphatase [Balneatrix alpica]
MATYVIGDIQGCYAELCQLLELIEFNQDDRLWLTGDLVNRGPGSLETLRLVKSLGQRAVTVLGNHDLHLLAVAAGLAHQKKGDTLQAILDAPDREELLDWLRQQPLLHVEGRQVLVHAGLPPIWSVNEAQARAQELQQVLRSPRYQSFLAQMYGNQPDCWRPDLQGIERLRLITNYFTRMRFVGPHGELELKSKSELDKAPLGYQAWFYYPNPEWAGTHIYFGHWAALQGQTGMHDAIALDTGCVWGNCLTAQRLEDGQRFSVASQQPQSLE